MSNFLESKEWMYNRFSDSTHKNVSEEYVEGVNFFIDFACSHDQSFLEREDLLCPCKKCKNQSRRASDVVANHLFMKGFTKNYYVWTHHGEYCDYGGEASTSHHVGGQQTWSDYTNNQVHVDHSHNPSGDINMFSHGVNFSENNETPVYEDTSNSLPNTSDCVFQALEAIKQPLYEGCPDGISQLYLNSKVMHWKTNYNISEACLDDITRTFKAVLPSPNKAPKSYYETKKLTRALGLPCQKIDVCEDNCMLFWKGEDRELTQCRFCGKDRYEPNVGRSGKKIPKQRMFYLPIADRLKRLYQSETTSSHMRWHAEHVSPEGEMHHPSDGEAWKHFQKVYPAFTSESRNVYLGLSTDGFNPIGMNGQSYSVWPVIVTPYNLPPGMCMKREFFFLSILVPGPNHPKKSLDIYLQPLIEELQNLWSHGVEAYDVSRKEKFTMRVVLMWTISDFPAYGMLSGWTTHGNLACPYCMDETKSFWLPKGRKHSWFDCHRRFLPRGHPYRRNVRDFRKGEKVLEDPPPWLIGEEILYERINSIHGLRKTVECGGKGHDNVARELEGYGVYHNWVKKNIFWELPYWENLLLRFNIDFMHTEKNVHDNITNTVLNVPGKTKDTEKSRMDLCTFCERPELEYREGEKVAFPNFRLTKEGKGAFLLWMKNSIKFPEGYVSKFSRCVNVNTGKISGLKSHDCHVIMQRLLPIAFSELLPKPVHTAISDIALFFRDISTRILKIKDVVTLKETIALKICNFGKIFPPSFFDVMEHLPVHLPDEALLGGPVQYRWMYLFERYMYHLKKKVKNKERIGGSIVAQCVNEEISYVTSNYIETPASQDHLDNVKEVRFTYNYPDVPIMFQQVGKVSGNMTGDWLKDEDYNVLQTFLLLNCEEFAPYKSMFEEYMIAQNPNINPDEMTRAKDNHFAWWCRDYINNASESYEFSLWMLEFVQGPKHQTMSWPMHYTRGYHFHTHQHGENKKTMNYGVCVHGTVETEDYGLIKEIFLIEYSGAVGLKAMIFKCEWFNTTLGRGIRRHPNGIVDVCPQMRYNKYDPFILPEQCDQVCYIPYPRVSPVREEWWATTKVPPGEFCESQEVDQFAFQDQPRDHVIPATNMIRVETRVFEDALDDEPTPMDNPNDEYVSENDLEDEYHEYSSSDSDSD